VNYLCIKLTFCSDKISPTRISELNLRVSKGLTSALIFLKRHNSKESKNDTERKYSSYLSKKMNIPKGKI
jgi:hypothetical protein